MKIASSMVTMAASRDHMEESRKQERLESWIGVRPHPGERDGAKLPAEAGDRISISPKAMKDHRANGSDKVRESVGARIDEILDQEDADLYTVKLILEQLTGKKINLRHAVRQEIREMPQVQPAAGAPQGAGWGIAYDSSRTYYEREEVKVSLSGMIKTSDEKEVNFSMQLYMAREYFESSDLSVRAGDAQFIDPLVVNFGAPAASLRPETIYFDLNMDGVAEEMNFTGAGSGFLTLDKNNDGLVNNGGELFGPATGHGFDELASYDSDNNGWLDENDPIFEKLQIWGMGASGEQTLRHFREVGIGAIFLGKVDSQFVLRDADGIYGQLRETGFFLREDFSIGTVQEVDLAV